jgi:hypothetical protein
MDDNFLYQNKPPVRQGFGESLYSRISSLPLQKQGTGKVSRFAVRLAFITVILFTVLFTFSQPVRASVLQWLREIAGFEIEERDSLGAADEIDSIPPDYHSNLLEDVIGHLPYELSMPAYVPDGFLFQKRVSVTDNSIFMHWTSRNGDEILMLVDTDHGQRYVTGTDAAREIQVNGQPAMLIQGGFDSDNNWNPDMKMMNLVQRKDDVIYWLVYIVSSDGEFDSKSVQDELIHMMSSLKKPSIAPK